MRQEEHHVQDAAEVYAVHVMQQSAQELGVAADMSAPEKFSAYEDYLAARGLMDRYVREGPYASYLRSVDIHVPAFVVRLAEKYAGEPLSFTDVEAASRNANLKADFLVETRRHRIPFSLKNYRGSIARPQVCSGTYNSFIVNFLFDSCGVGSWINPLDGSTFRSSPEARNAAFLANGYGHLVPYMTELDRLNAKIKARFVYGTDFEFLDEFAFDVARKECGTAGASICLEILSSLPTEQLRKRILKMTGLDGFEEVLMMDPVRSTDSVTSPAFHRLLESMDRADVSFDLVGQGLRFAFHDRRTEVLRVDVPFTINKNGAWISETTFPDYPGAAYHRKEGVYLSYGQRRPKKSKELATSVNTYVDFERAGIFVAVVDGLVP